MTKVKKTSSWKMLYAGALTDCRIYWKISLVYLCPSLAGLLLASPIFVKAFNASQTSGSFEKAFIDSFVSMFVGQNGFIFMEIFLLISILATFSLFPFLDGAIYKTFFEGIKRKKPFSLNDFLERGKRYFVAFLGIMVLEIGLAIPLLGAEKSLGYFSSKTFSVFFLNFLVIPFKMWIGFVKVGLVEGFDFSTSTKSALAKLKMKKAWAFKGLFVIYGLYSIVKFGGQAILEFSNFNASVGIVGKFILQGIQSIFGLISGLYFSALFVRFGTSKYIQDKAS